MEDLRHRLLEPPLADPRALPPLGLLHPEQRVSQPARPAESSGQGSVDERTERTQEQQQKLWSDCEDLLRSRSSTGQGGRLYTERERKESEGDWFPVFHCFREKKEEKKLHGFNVEGNMAVNILPEVSGRRRAQQ